MALRKTKLSDPPAPRAVSSSEELTNLLRQLHSSDVYDRRWAARDLVAYPQCAPQLLEALKAEGEHSVRESLFDSLQHIGNDQVVAGMIEILRCEDAELRNGAIELLQSKPQGVAQHIIELLNDRDSDVRIFAIDILQMLAHPSTPEWLLSVLKDELHVNVIATAVDRLTEVGTPDMVPQLRALKQRFANDEYINFAVDTAINRIEVR